MDRIRRDHFQKQEKSPRELPAVRLGLYSPSLDAIFDVIGEMGAVAVVHCDHDTPAHNLALQVTQQPTR